MNSPEQPNPKALEEEVATPESILRKELAIELRKGRHMFDAQITALSLAADSASDAAQASLVLAEIQRINKGLEDLLHSKIH